MAYPEMAELAHLFRLTLLAGLIGLCAPLSAAQLDDAQMGERLRACAACHGEGGRSSAETYYPSIAGKPAGYLHLQLENFRDGRRRHAVMQGMLAYLSDDYLREIAAYYSAQAPVHALPATAAAPAVLERGRRLVEQGDAAREIPACSACHGAALTGVVPSIPGLLGLRMDYLAAQLGGWRTGTRLARAPDCMSEIARRLGADEIDAVTAWLASQPYPADHRPATSLPAPLPLSCGGVQ